MGCDAASRTLDMALSLCMPDLTRCELTSDCTMLLYIWHTRLLTKVPKLWLTKHASLKLCFCSTAATAWAALSTGEPRRHSLRDTLRNSNRTMGWLVVALQIRLTSRM